MTKNILIVEDSPEIAEVLTEITDQLEHKSTVARDAETALKLITDHTFDIIMTDHNLPGMSVEWH